MMKHNKFVLGILLMLITISTTILNINIVLADEISNTESKNIISEDSEIISSEEIDHGVRVNYIKDGTITIVIDKGSNTYSDNIGTHWKDVTIKLKEGQGNCYMHLYEQYAPDNIQISNPNILATDTITLPGVGNGTYILSKGVLKNTRGRYINIAQNGKKQYVRDGNIITGWERDVNTWYYADEEGFLQNGWKQIDGEWYYFDDNGSMERGWIKDNGKWYYLYYEGSMAHDTKIDGYYVNKNGQYVE